MIERIEIKNPLVVEAEHWNKVIEFLKNIDELKIKENSSDDMYIDGIYDACKQIQEYVDELLKEIGEL